jgi:hypothetical protein
LDRLLLQIEAAHKHETIQQQDIADWGIRKGPNLANMHLAQGHLDEQLKLKGKLVHSERIINNSWQKHWNIKRPSWHGGDNILGNKCRKLMAWTTLNFEKIKAFLLEQLEVNGGSERAKREVTKRCDIVTKALLLFDIFPSLLRTDHKDLTP